MISLTPIQDLTFQELLLLVETKERGFILLWMAQGNACALATHHKISQKESSQEKQRHTGLFFRSRVRLNL